MKSPKHSTLPESKQMKLSPASAATSFQRKHKITNINTDEGLQSTDARRRYMRRGSKTPTMLLIEASRDLDIIGQSLFPTLDGQHSNITNISYHALNSRALAMASAIDVLPDSYLINCRVKRRSNPWVSEGKSLTINSYLEANTNPDAIPTYEGDEMLRRKVQTVGNKYIQPRRLSAMTALKQHLEKASISHVPAPALQQGKDD